ncbi:hypothetical protein Tco_0642504 [Tanacetum coccineum]
MLKIKLFKLFLSCTSSNHLFLIFASIILQTFSATLHISNQIILFKGLFSSLPRCVDTPVRGNQDQKEYFVPEIGSSSLLSSEFILNTDYQFLSLNEELLKANHPQSSVLGHALVGMRSVGVRRLVPKVVLYRSGISFRDRCRCRCRDRSIV